MFLSGREKEQETLEGDNLFTSEASSAAFFFLGFESGRSRPSRGKRNHLVCSDHSEIILKIHRLNLTTSQECLRVISGSTFQLVDWLIDIGLFKTDNDSECAGLLQTSHLSQHLYLFLRIFRTYEKQNALNFSAHILGDLCGESGFQEQFLQVQEKIQRRWNDYCNRKQDASSQDSISWHRLWVCCFSHFLFPSAHSHAINFISLSIRKSSSFHAMTCFFPPLLVEFPLERSGSSFNTRLNPQFHLCDARILSKSISLSSSSDHSSCRL